MSHHQTNQTWDIDSRTYELSAHCLLVLLRLAHLSVMSTGEGHTSVPELAVKCRMSDSSVRRQLRTLESMGFIMQFKEGSKLCFRLRLPRPELVIDGQA